MRLFYHAATGTMKALLFSFSHWQVEGKENIPRDGPLIVVANHLSLIDPPLLSASIPRKVVFMAKEELFASKGGWFVRAFEAFPVKRGEIDRQALRLALAILKKGGVLGMFPEGKRSPQARLQTAQPGVSLIALRSGAPLLPVGITGSEKVTGAGVILKRPHISVTIGRPFSLRREDEDHSQPRLDELTTLTMNSIASLLPPDYRGAYSNKTQGQ
ncbi:MAG: 1-acyl-sn-glycerol-3-phosphate acyltransferase [Chloroflexi bacterium]|nr:1-acyl-sn-glycerol-3-phosphate acyltransferase [Chloroflexota bacterium]